MRTDNRLAASALKGGIPIIRERDIRRRGKPFNDMVECEPAVCNCCGRDIYKVAILILGRTQNGNRRPAKQTDKLGTFRT